MSAVRPGFIKNYRSSLQQLISWVVEALFPRRCVTCGRWGEWCCPVCWAALTYARRLTCPDCQVVTNLGEFCQQCAPAHTLKGLWPAQSYSQPTIRQLIKILKFEGVTEVAPILANLMRGLLKTFNLPPSWHAVAPADWCLTSVPLTSQRLRQRNFNQAEMIARLLSSLTGLTYQPTLQRVGSKKPQSELTNETARKKNVEKAFALLAETEIAGRVFILVDDVYTSGATMEECARILKAGGATEIWGLVAAKG